MEKRAPEEFDWILVQFNAAGVTPVVVAGQAVNIWGKVLRDWNREHFPHKPKIDDLIPLTSEDMEILRTTGTSAVDQFTGVIGKPDAVDPFAKAAGPDYKTIYLRNAEGSFKIQVLAWVNGLDNKEIEKRTVLLDLGQRKATVLVPDPIVLLTGKIANLHRLDQKHRQDFKHVQILINCVHAVIGQTAQAPDGTRNALNLIKRFQELARSKYARDVQKKYSIDWNHCIPIEVIRVESATKPELKNFLDHFTKL